MKTPKVKQVKKQCQALDHRNCQPDACVKARWNKFVREFNP